MHTCQLFRKDASFSSLVLLSSSVSTANLCCLLATTFSSLRFFSTSPRFNLLRVWRCFSWLSIFRVISSILSLSFPCSSISEALFSLRFSLLSERFFFVHAKAALARSRNKQHGCHSIYRQKKKTLTMREGCVIPPTQFI